MTSFLIELTEKQCAFLKHVLPKGCILAETKTKVSTSATVKSQDTSKKHSHNSEENTSSECSPFSEERKETVKKQKKAKNQEESKTKKQKKKSLSLMQKISIISPTKTQDSMSSLMFTLLEEIWKRNSSEIFKEPVDPVKLKIPTYFNVIKNPMDLSTMKLKVKESKYQNFTQFEKDLDLIAENCKIFNKGNKFFIQASDRFSKDYKKIIEQHKGEISQIFSKKQQKQGSQFSQEETNSQKQPSSKVLKKNLKKKEKDLGKKESSKIEAQKSVVQQAKPQIKEAQLNEIPIKDTQKQSQKNPQPIKIFVTKNQSISDQKKAAIQQKNQQVSTNKNSLTNPPLEEKKSEKEVQNAQKPKSDKSYSYDERLKIVSRIRALDKTTMAQFFKSINFSKGQSLDFRNLEDTKIRQIETTLSGFEVTPAKNKGENKENIGGKNMKSESFQMEDDEDYKD